jgi:hypothetical protein
LKGALGFKRLFECVHVVGRYSKYLLHLHDSGNEGGPLVVEVLADAVGLDGLAEEARVLGLLAIIGLVDNVFQDVRLLQQVAFDVGTLGGRHLSNSFLFRVQNVHLFLTESSLLSELEDIFLNLVEGGREAEWLVRVNRVEITDHLRAGSS